MSAASSVAEQAADRQRGQRQQRQLAQQDQRDLRAREAEHAQAGQLAAALRQRDARGVVDDAERDDAGEEQVDEDAAGSCSPPSCRGSSGAPRA